jgi:hypothetical protein
MVTEGVAKQLAKNSDVTNETDSDKHPWATH